ncbi:MAG: hypothetical protein KGK11_05345 [Sphingomonadales bacterium]|nr:hypothetical protein [Sphingomonadales bacterium]
MRGTWPLTLLLVAAPAAARDSLGMFDQWGAFRDPQVPRCYAIARGESSHGEPAGVAYADVASWPKRGLRGEVHFHLSRKVVSGTAIELAIGNQRFALFSDGSNAWLADPRMNAAVVAAMRFNPAMAVLARDSSGRHFTDSWPLAGAASAMDSAAIGCAELR